MLNYSFLQFLTFYNNCVSIHLLSLIDVPQFDTVMTLPYLYLKFCYTPTSCTQMSLEIVNFSLNFKKRRIPPHLFSTEYETITRLKVAKTIFTFISFFLRKKSLVIIFAKNRLCVTRYVYLPT